MLLISEGARFGIIFSLTEFVLSIDYESGFGSPRKARSSKGHWNLEMAYRTCQSGMLNHLLVTESLPNVMWGVCGHSS